MKTWGVTFLLKYFMVSQIAVVGSNTFCLLWKSIKKHYQGFKNKGHRRTEENNNWIMFTEKKSDSKAIIDVNGELKRIAYIDRSS